MSNPKTVTKLLNYQNIDQDNYLYEQPQRVEGGNSVCYDANCYYDLGENTITPVFFETKQLITTTGIYNIGNEYMMDLEIPRGGKFLDFLLEEDELNINTVMENSEEWFGDEFPLEVVQEKYKGSLLFRNQGENPILRTEIPSQNSVPKIEIFNEAGESMNISDIDSNCRIACIMRKKGLRFMKETFNCVYMVYKIKVFSTSGEEENLLPPGDIFSDQEDSDSDDEPVDIPSTFSNVTNGDSDSDDDSDNESLHIGDLDDALNSDSDDDEEYDNNDGNNGDNNNNDNNDDDDNGNDNNDDDNNNDNNESDNETGDEEDDELAGLELDLQEVNLTSGTGGDEEELGEEQVDTSSNVCITPQAFPDFEL